MKYVVCVSKTSSLVFYKPALHQEVVFNHIRSQGAWKTACSFYSPQWFFQSTGWWSNNFPESAEHLTQEVLDGGGDGAPERMEGKKDQGHDQWGDKTRYG